MRSQVNLIGGIAAYLTIKEMTEWDTYCSSLPEYKKLVETQIQMHMLERKMNLTTKQSKKLMMYMRKKNDLTDKLRKLVCNWLISKGVE